MRTPQVNITSSPNRIISLDILKNFVDIQAGYCKLCKSTTLHLEDISYRSFTCSLELICDKCETNRTKLYNQMYHQKKLIRDRAVLTSGDAKVRKKCCGVIKHTKISMRNY